MTPGVYERMLERADRLERGLQGVIERARLPWSVTRLGARMEIQLAADRPRDAAQARAAMRPELERCLHLHLLDLGIVVTPFHNMLLVPPVASAEDVGAVVLAVARFAERLPTEAMDRRWLGSVLSV